MKGLLSAGDSLPQGHLHLDRGGKIPPPSPVGEWTRIAFLGAVLAALCLTVFHDFSGDVPPSDLPPLVEVKTPVPQIDRELLSRVDDRSRTSRILTEPEPFVHLLQASLNVVPAVAHALGLPPEPVPIALVRTEPQQFRGRYLWYRGILESAPIARSGHPVAGYEIHEARLRTPEGDQVVGVFSLPPDPSLREGSWVRMEGFFFKLRNTHLPVELDSVPVLIGPELLPAFETWKPITTLDPEVLARMPSGRLRDEVLPDGTKSRELVGDIGEGTVSIDTAQSLPLWHLASYAIEQARGLGYDEWNKVPRFLGQDQWREFVFGQAGQGKTVSLVGAVQLARTIEARANPVGIEHWTEVWIQVRELAGRVLPIWVPKRLEGWKPGDPALLVGHFFKLRRYQSTDDIEHIAPLFVAADLMHYRLPENPFEIYYLLPIAIALLGLLVFTIWYLRRDRHQQQDAAAHLVERRRRRRAATAVTGSAGDTPSS